MKGVVSEQTRRKGDDCDKDFKGSPEEVDNAPTTHEGPALIIRKAPHGLVWSVWATLEGTHSEELFEASSEEEASNWINTSGQTWLEERRQKRNS